MRRSAVRPLYLGAMTISTRRPVLLLVLCSVLGAAPGSAPGADAAVQPKLDDEVTLELAREELRTGRFWHAAELLEELLRGDGLEPEGLLLLAEARAGFRDWAGVREILEGNTWLDVLAPIRGHELLGRAYESAGEWDVALSHYTRAIERLGQRDFSLEARRIRAEMKSQGFDETGR